MDIPMILAGLLGSILGYAIRILIYIGLIYAGAYWVGPLFMWLAYKQSIIPDPFTFLAEAAGTVTLLLVWQYLMTRFVVFIANKSLKALTQGMKK